MESTTYGLIQLFRDGGLMMYPLLIASLLGLGVVLAKLYVLRIAGRSSRRVLEAVPRLARERRLEDALEVAARTPGPVAAILLVGLHGVRDRHRTTDVEKAMATAGRIEVGFLERGLVLLATVATVAPLLGFLGTVWGMIAAFAAIEGAGQVEATLVAAGIKVALITTAAGLIIAIPINVAYNYFVTRIDHLIVHMEEGAAEVLNVVWDVFEPYASVNGEGGRGGSGGAALQARE